MLGASGVGRHIRGDGCAPARKRSTATRGASALEEVDDDDALTAERLEALAEAKAQGTFGTSGRGHHGPGAPAGSVRLLNATD